MCHWNEVPRDVQWRLAQLAQSFADCRETFIEIADAHHWQPSRGSGADRAARDLPSPDPAIQDPRGETGHRLIAEVVATYLLAAAGHLGGLSSLYSSAEVPFPTAPLIRAAIENCAHVVWVVGRDHEEPSEDRLARAYLEELFSAEEEKKNAGRLGGKSGPEYENASQKYRTLKRPIIDRFDTDAEALSTWTLRDQVLLSPEKSVLFIYAVAEEFGSPIDQRAASGTYGALSNMTHPTLYPARRFGLWRHDAPHGQMVWDLRIDVGYMEGQASAALAAFYNSINWVTSYFGWPASTLSGLEDKIEAVLPEFFKAGERDPNEG